MSCYDVTCVPTFSLDREEDQFPSEDSPVMYLLANSGFDTAENEPSKILATSDVAQTITECSLITIQANIDERNAIMRVSTQYISTMIGTY